MMLKMLVLSGTHHFIDLYASKVRCYREAGGGSLRGLTFSRKTAKYFLPFEQWFLQAGHYAPKEKKPLRATVCFFHRATVQRHGQKINFKHVKPV